MPPFDQKQYFLFPFCYGQLSPKSARTANSDHTNTDHVGPDNINSGSSKSNRAGFGSTKSVHPKSDPVKPSHTGSATAQSPVKAADCRRQHHHLHCGPYHRRSDRQGNGRSEMRVSEKFCFRSISRSGPAKRPADSKMSQCRRLFYRRRIADKHRRRLSNHPTARRRGSDSDSKNPRSKPKFSNHS